MIKRIKRGDKLYIISSEIDVVSHLKPNDVTNKYIELNMSDLIETGSTKVGGSGKSLRLPIIKYDCSSEKIKPQTFAVVFNPCYKLGMTFIEAGKGENILANVELPAKSDASAGFLLRVYLLDADN